MKRTLFIIAFAFVSIAILAQDMHVVPLPKPNKERGTSVMKALSDRQSCRTFADVKLRDQDLSDLLWAANGINRPETGKRTAPSGLNKQEIELFVIMKDGAYYYDYKSHLLLLVSTKDLRSEVAGRQEAYKEAPLFVLIVANMSLVGHNDERSRLYAGVDAGIVCQNINIFCSAVGLGTVPRATMESEVLRKELNLTPDHLLLMNNPIGYKK